ncbi:MAG: DUF4878 domain-containing protein [Clostridium sp.]|uniref:hypothetical protein n=1 Tax=Clostridium sp. TaxID=1506 RepID=UPI002FC5F68E
MKKIIIAILSLTMLFGIAGCTKSKISTNVEKNSPENTINAFFSDFKKCNFKKAENYFLNGVTPDMEIYNNFTDGEKEAIKYWTEKIGYEIVSINNEGDNAEVTVKVMALNGVKIYNQYIKDIASLKKEAKTSEEKAELNKEYDKALLKEVKNKNNDIVTTVVTVQLQNIDSNWYINGDGNLLKALYGGLDPNKFITK